MMEKYTLLYHIRNIIKLHITTNKSAENNRPIMDHKETKHGNFLQLWNIFNKIHIIEGLSNSLVYMEQIQIHSAFS